MRPDCEVCHIFQNIEKENGYLCTNEGFGTAELIFLNLLFKENLPFF